MKRDIKEFVRINHHLMTVNEMAEETGIPADNIRYIMKQNNWEVLSPVDRIRDYIKAHPAGILEDIAELFSVGIGYIRIKAAEMGIHLVTRKQSTGVKELPATKPKYSLMHKAFNDPDPDGVREDLKIILGPEKPIKHIKDYYNQSSSPFGFADRLRGIK